MADDNMVFLGLKLPVYMHNELCKILNADDSENFSSFTRRALRLEMKRYKAREAKEFVASLTEEEKQCILNEIKKGN